MMRLFINTFSFEMLLFSLVIAYITAFPAAGSWTMQPRGRAVSINSLPLANNNYRSRRSSLNMVLPTHGGKIIVSGIGNVDQDEFMLNLLNEQVLF